MRTCRLVFACTLLLLVSLQVWTQVRAYHYGYHPLLGVPLWTEILGGRTHALYAPWQVFVWQWWWGSRVLLCGVGVGTLLGLTGLLWLRHRRPGRGQPPAMEGHGTTTWATRRDIRKAGLR